MPLDNFPESKIILENMRAHLISILPDASGTDSNGMIHAILSSLSIEIKGLYQTLNTLIDQSFVNTATGQFLERWGSFLNITRESAFPSTGYITILGISGSTIPKDTIFSTDSNIQYATDTNVTISTRTLDIVSLNRVGNMCNVITLKDHNLGTSQTVLMSGANEIQYNGTFNIVITGSNSFHYTIVSPYPTSPATGTLVLQTTDANVQITSQTMGYDTNLPNGAILTIGASISGVNNASIVLFEGLTGGADQESDEALRNRIIFASSNPAKNLSISDLKAITLTIPTIALVYIQTPDSLPKTITVDKIVTSNVDGGNPEKIAIVTTSKVHGLVNGDSIEVRNASESIYNGVFEVLVPNTTQLIYVLGNVGAIPDSSPCIALIPVLQAGACNIIPFTNDINSPIPSTAKITEIQNLIDNKKPAFGVSIKVLKPDIKTIDFDFTTLNPNTTIMKEAINLELQDFFKNKGVGIVISEDTYRSFLFNIFDSQGNQLKKYTLSSPSGDIITTYKEGVVLGKITFP